MKRFIPYILSPLLLLADAPYEPLPIQDHYGNLITAFQSGRWSKAVFEGKYITSNFPYSPFTSESHYYLGMAYFRSGNDARANEHLSTYLRTESTPKFFLEAIATKFEIAKRFQSGRAKQHLLGVKHLPKVIPDRELALEIFDEIIAALPRSDMAAEALFRKGQIYSRFDEYKDSIEAYQVMIRRFPKHESAPDSYVAIGEVYLNQCKAEYPDPDCMELARLNLERFIQDFPGEPRIEKVREMIGSMEESFAKELYEVGTFYQRTKKYGAAKLYYDKVINKYPTTEYALLSMQHMDKVNKALNK